MDNAVRGARARATDVDRPDPPSKAISRSSVRPSSPRRGEVSRDTPHHPLAMTRRLFHATHAAHRYPRLDHPVFAWNNSRTMKCTLCETDERAPKSRWCRDCKARYMREWRKTHPLTGDARRRANCRSYTHVLIARGHLVKGPCEVCGDPDVEAHHDDYSKPRAVRWLCVVHHRSHHKLLVPHVPFEISTQVQQNEQPDAS